MESLFSFGLYVEYIMGWRNVSTDPAIAFRLLDYPTVAVHCSPEKSENTKSSNSEVTVGEKKHYFRKGKSCLFKHSVEDLSRVIKQIPLYVMVFDSNDKTSQLKGCCAIPLRNLYHDIEKKMAVSGPDAPVTSEETGLFVAYDLMGTKTGELRLQLKLSFYGTSLIKHTNNGRTNVTDPLGSLGTYLDLNNSGNNHTIVNSARVKPLLLNHAVESKMVQCDINNNREHLHQQPQLPQQQQQNQPQQPQQEQLQQQQQQRLHPEQIKLVHGRQRKKKKEEPQDVNFNVYCPPPLFLNLYVTNIHQSSGPKKSSGNETDAEDLSALRSRYGTPDSNLSVAEPYQEVLQPVENRNCYKVQSDFREVGKKSTVDKKDQMVETKTSSDKEVQGVRSDKGDLSKFPLLSALSSEILTLMNFINKNDGNTGGTTGDKTESILNAGVHASVDGKENSSPKFLESGKADTHPCQQRNVKNKVPDRKNKLYFKTTRAQKLRSRYNMKEFKPKPNIEPAVELEYGADCGGENDLILITKDDVAASEDSKVVDDVTSIQSSKQEMQHHGSEEGIHSVQVAKESRSAQTTPVHIRELTPRSWQRRDPGFPPDHHEHSLPRPSSSAQRRERSSRSGARSRCSVPSRNLESSNYAFDTFSSEDADDDRSGDRNKSGSRSSSIISQTSSISLPLSREVSEKSQSSKGSGKSRSASRKLETRQTTRSLPEASIRSDKSESPRRALRRSHSDNRPCSENKSFSDDILHKLPSSVRSGGSDKVSRRPSRSSSEKYSMSNKENDNEGRQKEDDSVHSSMLNSVNLERYQDAESTTFQASTEKNTNDLIIDGSRPATQASVNTIPEDSLFSPRHISSAEFSEPPGSPMKDRNVTPTEGVLSPLDLMSGSTSPDKMRGVRPNNSSHSPRKSKHTAPTFQMSKRTHGLGKLEERPSSEVSGDTTMREIDMFIGDELTASGASGGSSFVMTTDENVSPILSASLTRFKPGLNKFDSRQVETVEEVEAADEIEKKEEDDQVMPMKRSTYVDVDVPMTSDFSPAQSKLFTQKKKYENVFRESLPHFSSNTNESSNDV